MIHEPILKILDSNYCRCVINAFVYSLRWNCWFRIFFHVRMRPTKRSMLLDRALEDYVRNFDYIFRAHIYLVSFAISHLSSKPIENIFGFTGAHCIKLDKSRCWNCCIHHFTISHIRIRTERCISCLFALLAIFSAGKLFRCKERAIEHSYKHCGSNWVWDKYRKPSTWL